MGTGSSKNRDCGRKKRDWLRVPLRGEVPVPFFRSVPVPIFSCERLLKLILAVLICVPACSLAAEGVPARPFAGRDVHISGDTLTTLRGEAGIDVLVIEKKFQITAGADTFKADNAVVWLKHEVSADSKTAPPRQVWCCLSGSVSASKGKGTRIAGLNWQTIEDGRAMVILFSAAGDVFITAQNVRTAPITRNVFYSSAFKAVSSLDKNFAASCESVAPAKIEQEKLPPQILPPAAVPAVPSAPEQKTPARNVFRPAAGAFGFIEKIFGTPSPPTVKQTPRRTNVRYPVNLAPAGVAEPNVEFAKADGKNIATIIGRFYLWQKSDEQGNLLEMQADDAVVFYSSRGESPRDNASALENLTGAGAIEAIYVKGDVVFTEGLRTIRADEMYYDFLDKKGLAVNAVIRTFDVGRGIPVYIRAEKIRQLAENSFAADKVVLTTSEFALPQFSLQASRIIVTDNTPFAGEPRKNNDSAFDVQIYNMRLKAEDLTVFQWPYMRSNLERPDVPFKTVRIGHDNIFGTSVETKWFLSRLLGLQEPPGTDSSFDLDYYSKRGLGAGLDVDYKQESRLGTIYGYIINDRGEDRLGRIASRRNIEPSEELRGWFNWTHREFMPYNWQLTAGIDYESDEYFVESYYRSYFNTGPDRETYLHLKRIEDNWGLSLLGKGRINNFEDVLAEYPSGEFHLTGQSIFNDKMTIYSDTQAGQFRQFIGDYHNTAVNEDPFNFGSHRTEIDMPVWLTGFKVVPFASITVGYDDRSGFDRSLLDVSHSAQLSHACSMSTVCGI
jgi:hypothetical protein